MRCSAHPPPLLLGFVLHGPSIPLSAARAAAKDRHRRRKSEEVLDTLDSMPHDPVLLKPKEPVGG